MPARRAALPALTLLAASAAAQAAAYAPWPTAPGAASLLVLDPLRGRVVAVESTPEARLWEWDGTAFAQRFGVPGPGAGAPFAAYYDPVRSAIVALTSTGERTFDGARWTTRSATTPFNPGLAPATAYDSTRRRLVALVYPNVLEWDGAQWITGSSALTPGPRSTPAFAYDPLHRRTVLYGGTSSPAVFDDCWAWDGAQWTLLQGNAPPGPRSAPSLAFEPATGRMILHGGDAAATTWALAGSAWTPIATTRQPIGRDPARLVADGIGLLLHGGSATRGGELWRFQNNDWQRLAGGSPTPRANPAFAWDPARGNALLFGGARPAPHWDDDDTWTFAGRWQRHTTSPRPPARSFAGLAWSSPDNALLLFGGSHGQNDTWLWNGAAWLARSPATSPPPRREAALVTDPSGGVLLFGGVQGQTWYGDQWLWDGVDWRQQFPAAMPGPRALPLAAHDPLRGVVVLTSGYGPTSPQDTWEWNGAQWAQRAAPPFVVGTRHERACFRPDTGRVCVFAFGQWEWDGVVWTAIVPQLPVANDTSLAVDPVRGRVLRFPQPGDGLGVLTPVPASAQRYGVGCAIGPAPGLAALGRPTPGAAGFHLATTTFCGGAPVLLAFGLGTATTPLGSGCSVLLGPVLGVTFDVAGPAGEAQSPLVIPPDLALRGVAFVVQAAVIDAVRGLHAGLTFSDALRVAIGD